MRKLAMERSQTLLGRNFDVALEDIMSEQFSQRIKRWKRVGAEVGTMPLRWADQQTALSTWIGSYKRAVAPKENGGLGYGQKEAARYADDILVRTQASAWRGDVSQFQRTPLGRFFSVFQTFVINEWDWLASDVLGRKGRVEASPSNVKKVVRLLLASQLINFVFDEMGVESPVPNPLSAIKESKKKGGGISEQTFAALSEFAEQIPVIGGAIRYTTPYRTALPTGVQQISDLFGGGIKLAKAGVSILGGIEKFKKEVSKLSNTELEALGKIIGIPGTTQFLKYARRNLKGMTVFEALSKLASPEELLKLITEPGTKMPTPTKKKTNPYEKRKSYYERKSYYK